MNPLSRRLLAVLFTAALLLTACTSEAPDSEDLEGPAASLDALLELRYDRSTDASSYAEYVESADVAIQLADSARDATDSPIPEWESPYVSELGTSTASVVVVWQDPGAFDEEWPLATIFEMVLRGDRWITADAVLVRTEDEIPAQDR